MLLRYCLVLLFFFSLTHPGHSQDVPATPMAALELFRQGDYSQAREMYQTLMATHNRDAKINYYYGICLLKTNWDISESIKRLKYAASKGVSRDVHYYLGRAYQLNFEFNEAINSFNSFLKYAKDSDVRKEKALQYQQEAEYGKASSAKIYYLEVVGKDTTSKDQLLQMYHPVKDAGYVLYNQDFFESGVAPNGILYLTERKDAVYFAMQEDETGNNNLYKMEKLIDGWSETLPLKGINSEYDEVYPYLQLDGETLYFTSNRPGGMGGYDIYTTTYDTETKSYTEPVNLGIPFNSPKDDYFFVSDEFSNVAWFASNRHTTNDQVMVYQIIWDENVVKNVVYDEKDVKISASMPVMQNIPEEIATRQEQIKATQPTRTQQKALFHFKINNDITHNDFSHFENTEALRLFKSGYLLEQKKDSLSALMQGKRNKYSSTQNQNEREVLVNEILTLEKQVYGLDAEITDFYFSARQKERSTIDSLVRKGQYQAPVNNAENNAPSKKLKEILIPEEYTYYTDDAFTIRLQRLDAMYRRLFTATAMEQLKQADSLYVWGNILTLEASNLMEKAARAPERQELVISSPFKQKEASSTTDGLLISKSRELKTTAIKLYHQSLDTKYQIFRDKIKEVVLDQPTIDFTYLEERQAEANAYVRQSSDELANGITFNPELYEKAGTLKREAVSLQEEALFLYLDFLDGKEPESSDSTQIDNTPDTTETKAVQAEQQTTSVTGPMSSNQPIEAATDNTVIYKIQIGVFRNEPSAAALKKIPPVTQKAIPGKELTKYFAGSYTTLEEATQQISLIQEAGFPGAFVVAFLNDEQISLSKAKTLTQ
jgi:hypothetical protein